MQTNYYDAFICHAIQDNDIKFAGIIYKELLNYKIPGNITRKNGIKKINSVYLDSPGDDHEPLDQKVIDALNQSRYLIVVCSPNMIRSFRAQQILEYFWNLKNGEYIITIIIEGTPEEAFPPLVRQVKRNGEILSIEPLAADIGAGYPNIHNCVKLFKTERLRLISPIIGCTYDDLRRRYYHATLSRTFISLSIVSALFLYIFIATFLFVRDVDKKEKLLNAQKTEAEQKLKEATDIANSSNDTAYKYYSKLIDEYEENGTGGDSLIELLKTGNPYSYPDTDEGRQQRQLDMFYNAGNVAMVLANYRVPQNSDKYADMSYYFDYLFHDEFDWIKNYEEVSYYLYGYEMFFVYVVNDPSETLSQGDIICAIEGQTFDNVSGFYRMIDDYNEYYDLSKAPNITVSVLRVDSDGNVSTEDYSIDFSLLTWIIA